MAKIKITDGDTTIEASTQGMVDAIDAITKGTATAFIDRAGESIQRVEDESLPLWPVASGRSQAGWRKRTRIIQGGIRVGLENAVPYTKYVRFSKRTAAEMDEQARAVGAAFGGSGTPQALKEQVARAATVLGSRLGRRPTAREATVWWRGRLTKWHGKGAPDERLAGKSALRSTFDRHLKEETPPLVKDLQSELTILAGDV